MRAGLHLAVLAALGLLALPGCGALGRPLGHWPRPAPVTGGGPASAGLPSPGLGGTAPAEPTPAPPAGSTAVAAPPPAGPPAVPPAPAAAPPGPSRPLTASLPQAETRRLHDEAQRGIEEAERLLRQLDGRPLGAGERETVRLAQSLVEQARRALGSEEYERAANLAAKARTLAVDLSTQR